MSNKERVVVVTAGERWSDRKSDDNLPLAIWKAILGLPIVDPKSDKE